MNLRTEKMALTVRIQEQAFDISTEVAALGQSRRDIGAVVTFTGLVRDINAGDEVSLMTLEHYPGMTEKAIEEIVEEATIRWNLRAVTVIHRIGTLLPGEQIVFVAVASAHRGDSFLGCEFIMDYLKTKAPFWKKETVQGDDTRWVDSRVSDIGAAERWRK